MTGIIDSGTFDIRLTSRKTERVQLLGVDTPGFRLRECFARKAKKELCRLVLNSNVIIRFDPTQVPRTSQEQLLAYANRPGRFDVGKRIIALVSADIIQPKKGFKPTKAYRCSEKKDERLDSGLWHFYNSKHIEPAPLRQSRDDP